MLQIISSQRKAIIDGFRFQHWMLEDIFQNLRKKYYDFSIPAT